jgi:beta-lactam-binding protein with PASTA domain
MDLLTAFAAQGGLSGNIVSLKEPLMYEYSTEPAGIVLHQNPEPGTNVSGPVSLELVVSRGGENTFIRVPSFVGFSLENTLEQIGRMGIDFGFTVRSAQNQERPGTVVAQDPPEDTLVSSDTRVEISFAAPNNLPDNEVFGLFTYDMARNPYPLLVRLESIQPSGERQRLLSVQDPGGRLTVPFIQPAGSVLVLSMLNREIHRETITHSAEALPMTGFR